MRDYTLADVLLRNAQVHGERTAFIAARHDGGTARISHRAHLERVRALAGGLAGAGVVAGDRIAVLAHNSPAYVELIGAAAWLGAMLVPVNWRFSAEEIEYVLADTTPKVVFSGAGFHDTVATLRARLPFIHAHHAMEDDDVNADPPGDGVATWASLPDGAASPAHRASAAAGVVIMHTAAVGGKPRGAVLSHAGLVAGSLQLIHALRLHHDDVNLCALPLLHISGLALMLACQQAGAASVLMPRYDVPLALGHIETEHVTVFGAFAPMLSMLLDGASAARGEASGALSSLRVVTGLDTPDTIERFERICPEARFWSAYGQTEVSGFATLRPYRDCPGASGQAALLSCVAIVDEHDRPVAAGQVGEIVVRGPVVFNGYWNHDAEREFGFRNGRHHCGDLGRFDADGNLWYAGRSPAKELIKSGGENVYPLEVETVLCAHPAIELAVVFGVPDTRWGEIVKAVCVRRAGHEVSADELMRHVGAHIARYKIPRQVVFVDDVPRTAAGAVDRAGVKGMGINGNL